MKKLLILICFLALSFYSCAIRNSLAPKIVDLADDRTFVAQQMKGGDSAGYFNIPAKLIKTTDNLAVYLQNGKDVSAYALNKMAQEFDYHYDDMTNIYGGHSDVDGNGKIIIVLMQVNTEGANGNTLAYFNPYDMYAGNRGEILYLDVYRVNKETEKAIGTLIHEFQHLINYSHVTSGKRKPMSSWLNEALSESTSVLFNKATVKSRIEEEFNKISYYCFYTWNVPDSAKGKGSFINYPSASVFMHWLYIKNGSNSNIFRDIAQSKESADWMKVLSAAKKSGKFDGVNSWGDLLLAWMKDMVECKNLPSGAKINKTNASNTVPLYPGAIVVFNSGSNCVVANEDITLDITNYKPISVTFSSGGGIRTN